jgi:segregation and condensation protein B
MGNSEFTLSKKIEALLFYKAEPLTIKKISSLVEEKEENVKKALDILSNELNGRGISLIQYEDEYTLASSKMASDLIEKIRKEELNRDLGKAGIETLSIIIYQGPVSRAEIDYIRGVNSQFIVRNLVMRGLVERVENDKDARSYLYKPSMELITHLGLTKIDDIPEYEEIRKKINTMKEVVSENDKEITNKDHE